VWHLAVSLFLLERIPESSMSTKSGVFAAVGDNDAASEGEEEIEDRGDHETSIATEHPTLRA
jgi:hypothetical protein